MKSNIVSVTNHQRRWPNKSTIVHTATVVVEEYDSAEERAVTNLVSEKAGYDPRGYVLYFRDTKVVPTGNPNEYAFEWQTAASCD